MTGRRSVRKWTAIAFAAALVAGGAYLVREAVAAPWTITANFATATAIYPGDDVRVSGVKVGTIDSIDSGGTTAKMTLRIDHGIAIPEDARAVIVVPNLVAARYVQLTPAYTKGRVEMREGATIPTERTAIPVEWDEVKTQLTRLATELGPRSGVSGTSLSQFVNSTADALAGNGAKLRDTIHELSHIARIFAENGGDLVSTIENLQTLVTALRDSNVQIVQFQNRLATLTDVVDGSRSDLDAALTNLSTTVDDVKRFVAGSRNQTAEQLQRLANVTQILVDHKSDVENLLHAAPNQIANAYNIFNPDSGTVVGSFAFQNMSNPVQFICASIGAVQNVTAPETAKLCSQYLGPALNALNFNYLPFPISPILAKSTDPDHMIYQPSTLGPGNGPQPAPAPSTAPSVSAYTGLNGDVPPPPGWDAPAGRPGAYAPNGLPADPSPALFPGAPLPPGVPAAPAPPASLPQLLLPAETPPPSNVPNAGGTAAP